MFNIPKVAVLYFDWSLIFTPWIALVRVWVRIWVREGLSVWGCPNYRTFRISNPNQLNYPLDLTEPARMPWLSMYSQKDHISHCHNKTPMLKFKFTWIQKIQRSLVSQFTQECLSGLRALKPRLLWPLCYLSTMLFHCGLTKYLTRPQRTSC